MRSFAPVFLSSSCWLVAFGISPLLVHPAAAGDDPPDPQTAALLQTFNTEFVEIMPGKGKFPAKFVMGAKSGPKTEQPAHDVTLGQGFQMAKYEVPQNLYEAVMGVNPSKWKGPRNSVEFLTFADAQEFCRRATRLMRATKLLTGDEEIRLPTEAEWEYCCRAGTTTAYTFGDDATDAKDTGNRASRLDEYAWHTGNAAGNDPPVGAKKPNPWGFYDMHGYLWEFVADAWHDNYTNAPGDGRPWTSDDGRAPRVVRGGSWKDRHEHLRSAVRRPVAVDDKDDAIGFRCVKAAVRS